MGVLCTAASFDRAVLVLQGRALSLRRQSCREELGLGLVPLISLLY